MTRARVNVGGATIDFAEMTLRFDAATFARGWLSVSIASGKDADLPVLDRTVAIEVFGSGVRLVATDRYILLHSWIPSKDNDLDDEGPELGTEPILTTVAADVHGRAKGFMGHMLALAAREDAKPETLAVTLNVVEPEEDPQGFFEGLDLSWVVLDYPNHERLRLSTVQSPWPAWRGLLGVFSPKGTRYIALNPEIVARLAKLGKLHDNAPLVWHFGGVDKLARLEVASTMTPSVAGAVMPIRMAIPAPESSPSEAR